MSNKILYVSPVWTNLKDYHLSDDFESGMPSFTEPLKIFLSLNHRVSFLWIKEKGSPPLSDPFLKKQNNLFIYANTKISLLFSFFKIFFCTLIEIKKLNPNIIYCHGAISAGAILASVICKKKTAVRVYGTNKYWYELERLGKVRFFFKYPFIFLMFSITSNILIATDDGSKTNKIYDSIGNAKCFYFLKNGFPVIPKKPNVHEKIILCVGRIEKKKNQIKALRFFEKIAPEKKNLKFFIIGETSDSIYYQKLKNQIKNSDYKDQVFLIGSLKKNVLYDYYKKADAVISFQDNSNFGNVAIECLTYGCLLITYDEDSFKKLADNFKGPIALLGMGITELALKYIKLSEEEASKIIKNGQNAITNELEPWIKRAKEEAQIIAG